MSNSKKLLPGRQPVLEERREEGLEKIALRNLARAKTVPEVVSVLRRGQHRDAITSIVSRLLSNPHR